MSCSLSAQSDLGKAIESDFYSFGRSLWRATAGVPPAGVEFQDGQIFDVIVVGGGIAGSTAALSLVEKGSRVALVEASELSCGATGRSGGHITPTFTATRPGELISRMGAKGEELVQAVANSANDIFELINKYHIDCDSGQNGWFQPAGSKQAFRRLEEDAKIWSSLGAEASMLDSRETEACTGVSGYVGSWKAKTGGTLHPVKFVQGVVSAAINKGLFYLANTSVTSYNHTEKFWQLITEKGVLFAEKVLICTNAQSAQLTPEIYQSVIPMLICHAATKPIPADQRQHLLKLGQAMTDTRANLFSYRFDSECRLITGAIPILNIDGGWRLAKKMGRRMANELNLPSCPEIEFSWLGRASITSDMLPRVFDIGPNGYALTACNGRGLSLSVLWARRVCKCDDAGCL